MRFFSTLALVVVATAGAASNAAVTEFDKTVAADPKGEVNISNVAGHIKVTGWDRPEVQVKAVLSSGSQRVDVTGGPQRIVIKVVVPGMSWNDADVVLDVHVPKQSELQVTGSSADVETVQVLGEQRLKSVSGTIHAELAAADFEGKTVSGDITLRGTSQPADLRVSTVSGSITLERGAGELDATTVSGDLRAELSSARSVRMHTTSGDLHFRGTLDEGATLEAETISGDVSVQARGKSGYEYEASSFSGELENCFGKSSESTSQHGPGSRLTGTLGKGDARIRAKSMSGDIQICDK
ncbi:MAG TPA: DUF4097 family beta strand repeat-containing protein [Steroidobacteraceae bacterium]|nr:DUF4097 family beta strand repeat-containing protein [Steroidobacteraceae bacterium]